MARKVTIELDEDLVARARDRAQDTADDSAAVAEALTAYLVDGRQTVADLLRRRGHRPDRVD